MQEPTTLAIVGAGKRGEAYAQFAYEHPEKVKVVVVAEPRAFQREQLAIRHRRVGKRLRFLGDSGPAYALGRCGADLHPG